MTFFQHLVDAVAYLFSRGYVTWFVSVPLAFGLIGVIGDLIFMKKE